MTTARPLPRRVARPPERDPTYPSSWPGAWSYRSPASEEALVALEAKIGMTLPADLRRFLRHSDGGSAWFDEDQGVDSSFYFQVFSVDGIAGTFEVGEPDDRLLAVASDGGSGWYFIDRRTNAIVMNYIDDADSEPIACAPSIAALVDRLAQGWRSH